MLIINAEFPAGLTIRQAIESALKFAEKNECMVRVNINDVPMIIFSSSLLGKTFDEKVDNFVNEYQYILKSEES